MATKNIHKRTIDFHTRNKNLSISLQEHLSLEILLERPVKYEEALVLSEENHLTKGYAEKVLKRYEKRSFNDLRVRIETVFPVCEKMICEVGEVWYLKDPILKTKTPIYFAGGPFKEFFKDTEYRVSDGEPIYFSIEDYRNYEGSIANFLNALDDFYTISEIITKIELMNKYYGCADSELLNMCITEDTSTDSILDMLDGADVKDFLRYHNCLDMAY